MKRYLLLAGVGFCCLSGTAWAELNCNEPPECDALGFTMTADECKGRLVLKCPFDQTQVYCSDAPSEEVDCKALGYTLTESQCKGHLFLTCPSDPKAVYCDASCDALGYTKTSCLLGQKPTECPLDSSKLKCSGKSNIEKCKDEGYSELQCSSSQNAVPCPYETGDAVKPLMRCDPKTSRQRCTEDGYTETSGNCPEGQERIDCPYNATFFKCGIPTTGVTPVDPGKNPDGTVTRPGADTGSSIFG